MVGAIAPTQRGGLIAALRDGIYLLDPDSGVSAPFATAPLHDAQAFRFNDAKVDPRGRYWAGTLALDDRRGVSRLYRIEADRSVAVMREGISISNGLAWSPDGATLYYIDSPTRTVQAFPFDLDQGTLGTPRVTIVLAEADGWPDGCAMDAEGCLWVAHWGAAKVTRWEPRAGRLLATVTLPVRNVTSCAFGGVGLDQLFITTAQNSGGAAIEPEAGYIFRLDPGVTGLAIANFAGG
jgi:sugar lactone lactonase YvrE